MTTTENGGSPAKQHDKNHCTSGSLLKIASNRDDKLTYEKKYLHLEHISRKLSNVESSRSSAEDNKKESDDVISEDAPSLNEIEILDHNESSSGVNEESENIENSLKNSRNAVIPDLQIQGEKMVFEKSVEFSRVSSDEEEEEDHRSNFERSVEFLPFIDTYVEPQCNAADEIEDKKEETNLRVPKTLTHCSEISENRVIDKSKDPEYRREILNTRSLEESESCRMTKMFLPNVVANSERLLSPQSARYNSEISDDYASSRSDSPSERRGSKRKASIFGRESRFRSVKNRPFESGKMTAKDKKLLKMILVIFSSFLICYLPITLTKTFKNLIDWRGLNIAGYILIYLTTCINPVIYVVMSSEYRCAYKNVLLCRSDSTASNCKPTKNRQDDRTKKNRETKKEFNN